MEHLGLKVQLLYIERHHCQRCPFLGLISAPFEKAFVCDRDASYCPNFGGKPGRLCFFVVVSVRPYHSTGVFREDRTAQSSIARSKRTQDPVLSVNQSGVVDRRQTR